MSYDFTKEPGSKPGEIIKHNRLVGIEYELLFPVVGENMPVPYNSKQTLTRKGSR